MAAQQGLHRVGARPPLWSYLRQTWQRRDFAFAMARFKIRSENERNRLGLLWVVLQPLLNALIYGAIFGVLQGDRRPDDFAQYVVIGVFLLAFFTNSLNSGAKSITGNRALVQSLSFPRMTLPLSVIIEQTLILVPSLAVMLGILLVSGIYPTWEWLLLIPLLLLLTLLSSGVALIAARLTVHIRDLTQLLPFISRVLFYGSGVLFDPTTILEPYPLLLRFYDWFPLHEVLAIARGLLLPGAEYDPLYWAYLAGWSVVLFVFGIIFFWVAEERYGRAD